MTDRNSDINRMALRAQELAQTKTVELTSDDHSIRVVAAPGGGVKELELNHRAYGMSGAELGPRILALLQEAQQRVDDELQDEIAAVFTEEA
ncbi:YbaB/EbfC family nucleoid-associated protein [Salininema proteolyticum]|uniref:YbaB/EbfC family nucleoid-associated protein n=1 Tax=Salininema proteolyticum TaxID=1607685 RepID=A0ABV8U2Y1_9ACTN